MYWGLERCPVGFHDSNHASKYCSGLVYALKILLPFEPRSNWVRPYFAVLVTDPLRLDSEISRIPSPRFHFFCAYPGWPWNLLGSISRSTGSVGICGFPPDIIIHSNLAKRSSFPIALFCSSSVSLSTSTFFTLTRSPAVPVYTCFLWVNTGVFGHEVP